MCFPLLNNFSWDNIVHPITCEGWFEQNCFGKTSEPKFAIKDDKRNLDPWVPPTRS